MPDFAEPLARLINEFKRLPGIGQKSAQRIAFHIMRASRDDADSWRAAILDVKDKLTICAQCNNISDAELCQYCRDPQRDQKVVCVVEDPNNIVGIEVTRQFNGLYHVLGGALSPLRGIGPEQLKIKSLVDRIAQGDDRGSNRRDQPDGGRRSDRSLSVEAAQAAGNQGDAHRHGRAGRQRHRIRRRSHDVEGHGRPPGDLTVSKRR